MLQTCLKGETVCCHVFPIFPSPTQPRRFKLVDMAHHSQATSVAMGDTCTVPCYSGKACLTSCAYPIYRWTYAAASSASRVIRPGAMNSHLELVPRSVFFFPHLSLYTKQQIQDSWLEIHLDLLHILHIFTVFTHFVFLTAAFSVR